MTEKRSFLSDMPMAELQELKTRASKANDIASVKVFEREQNRRLNPAPVTTAPGEAQRFGEMTEAPPPDRNLVASSVDGQKVLEALYDGGIVPVLCDRVVIDVDANRLVQMFYSEHGQGDIPEIMPAMLARKPWSTVCVQALTKALSEVPVIDESEERVGGLGGLEVLEALFNAGVVPALCDRVVIDIPSGGMTKVYYSEYCTGRMTDILAAIIQMKPPVETEDGETQTDDETGTVQKASESADDPASTTAGPDAGEKTPDV